MGRWVGVAIAWALVATGAAAGEPAGLDSLAAETLQRAFAYLDVEPSEWGFDKLYAEDDTFRISAVEELLGDPLRIPGWQAQLIGALRDEIGDPGALMGRMGTLCDARGDLSLPPLPHRLGRSPAEAVAMDDARDRLLASVASADRDREEAFAGLTPSERDTLLIVAPTLWGDWEEDAEKARKGKLHEELASPADTLFELGEDFLLDLAVKLDRAALTRASRAFLHAAAHLAADARGFDHTGPRVGLEGVSGALLAVEATDWGLWVVGGPGENTYSAEAIERIAFLIDLGGDDVYRGRIASAVGDLGHPFSVLIDLDGDDLYDARDRAYALGSGLLGVGALIDLAGDDIYRGEDGAEGVGCFGTGFLYDGAGVDFFEGRNLSQGAGAFGYGALISDSGDEAPDGPELQDDRAFEAGLRPVPGTGAVPIRFDENDTYLCARQSQGFASTFGIGLLYDRKGNDLYRAGGRYLHAPLLPHDFQSLSQGFSIGFRPRAGGGIGILFDEEGNDFYNGEVYAQGAAYWYSIGLLFDGGGNDRYLATQYAQGAGIHLAVGSLWDRGGDDHYASKFGVTQGTAHDLSSGMLWDECGNDYYLVSDGQAMSITNSTALFIDSQGDDFYATPRGGQGTVTWARGFCGSGIFLDLEGNDTYSEAAPAENGAVWRQRTYGLGIDLDRNLELPDEEVPEIVLTAEDSSRTVEELFETASIWEVGSAREKVRRARQGLIAKGMDAVRYVVAEKLGTERGLEYRAIRELAQSLPDSFAAEVLSLLMSEDEQVQRNVIALLGDLKHKEAREPLEQMLKQKKQRRHWNRIIGSLGRIGEIESAPRLRPFLASSEERRRIATIGALTALRDTAAVEELVDLLDDELLTVRAAATRALERLRAAAVEPLAESLAGGGQRALRVRTLGQIAVALRDSTDAVSRRARGRARHLLLDELGDVGRDDPSTRAAAVRSLVALGDEETLSIVRLRMEDEFDPLVLQTYAHAIRAREEE